MRYCPRCVTPYNRPGIEFDEKGRCNCATADVKRQIDWEKREREFRRLAAEAKRRATGYDCVIPVSGGKDSTWQVVTCLEHGLKPLCVSWRPPARTDLGQKNLANLIGLGVDHVDYSINPAVEKRFMYEALVRFGTPAIPMHLALFAIPLRLAVRFGIPLVVWGENSAFEYGGDAADRDGVELNNAWIRKYGCTFGTTAEDWIGDDLSAKDLTPYWCPGDDELERAGVKSIFLGWYFPWDPKTTRDVATAHGFRGADGAASVGAYDFADLDDHFISIHHWLKWYKFGFTRAFDNLSLEVRAGRLTRDQAIRALRDLGDQTPHEDIARFCAYVGISVDHFHEIAERFRNPEVWVKRNGRWIIDEFLVPDWNWS
ncbi:MAG: N-acetyl sugar amidotransferase [Planctomycetota bacterium]